MSQLPDYELGRLIGQLSEKLDGLIIESRARHEDNRARFVEIERTAKFNAERINTLWGFRNRIIAIAGSIAVAGGFVAHFISDAASQLTSHFIH